MKTALGILLVFAVATASGQMLTTSLGNEITYAKITTDYTLTNTTARFWQVETAADYYNAQNFIVNLDSAGGNHTNVALVVYGRISDLDTWTVIGDTINWVGTTSDTTIKFTNATEVAYKQFKLLFTGTGTGVTTISQMEFQQWYGLP